MRLQVISINSSTKIKEVKIMVVTTQRGSVIEILKFYPQKDFNKVKFDLSNENDSYIDTIKAKELRINKAFEYSKIELKFLKDHR
jgi:hypothetical protein